MKEERQAQIKHLLKKHQMLTIRQLQEQFPSVTAMTIHRDLNELEQAGMLVKIHGGARAVGFEEDPSFMARKSLNLKEKECIAKKALSLIAPASALFIDAGTTCMAIVKHLPDHPLTIFTTGANFAQELQRLTKATIHVCGGTLNRSNLALSGYSTIAMLENINIDIAFIGVSGYSSQNGFTCGKESEMQVKRTVISRAQKSALVFDSSKLNRLMPYTFAHFTDVEYIISDQRLSAAFLDSAQEAHTTVL